MCDLDDLFARLAASPFRNRQRLGNRERRFLAAKGMERILAQGRDFICVRLASAEPRNDGKQTPFQGHPIFVAQHATATCCRGCLAKWHRLPKGTSLSEPQIDYIMSILERWLLAQPDLPIADPQRRLPWASGD
ncbi:MAG: DUF4186 domain-containing protein [Planctomycetales bacterium]|nr:DUF4186 domain-containing protein [Planctomycetales bacterium]